MVVQVVQRVRARWVPLVGWAAYLAQRLVWVWLLAVAEEQAAKEASDARRSQVRTVDRSERIRTYNFPENRISDHRVGFKAHNLDQVLDGDLDAVIDACVAADQASRLSEPAR